MLTKICVNPNRKVILAEMDLFLKNLRILRRSIPENPSRINRLELTRIRRLVKKFAKNQDTFNKSDSTEPFFKKLKLYHFRIMEELNAVENELEKHSDSVINGDFYSDSMTLLRKISLIL